MTETDIRSFVHALVEELAEASRLANPRKGTHRFVIDINENGLMEVRYHMPNGYVTSYVESQLIVDPDILANLVQAKLATGKVPWYLDTGNPPGGPVIIIARKFQ